MDRWQQRRQEPLKTMCPQFLDLIRHLVQSCPLHSSLNQIHSLSFGPDSSSVQPHTWGCTSARLSGGQRSCSRPPTCRASCSPPCWRRPGNAGCQRGSSEGTHGTFLLLGHRHHTSGIKLGENFQWIEALVKNQRYHCRMLFPNFKCLQGRKVETLSNSRSLNDAGVSP